MAIDKLAVLEAGFPEDAALIEAVFFREPSLMPRCFRKHVHESVPYRNGIDYLLQPA